MFIGRGGTFRAEIRGCYIFVNEFMSIFFLKFFKTNIITIISL